MITLFRPLLGHPAFWTVPETTHPDVQRTGLPRLDAQLPNGGWPIGAVTELRPTHADIGAFSILIPTLVQLTQADRKVVLIASEQMPEMEALGEQGVRLRHVTILRAHDEHVLWAMEQKLRSGEIAMLVAWTDSISDRQIRRLTQAAEAGHAMAMLYRPTGSHRFSKASAVHLLLRPGIDGLLDIEILKPRGQRSGTVVAQGTRSLPRSRPQGAYPQLAYAPAWSL